MCFCVLYFVLLCQTNYQSGIWPARVDDHVVDARVTGNAPGRLAALALQPAIRQVRLANQGTAGAVRLACSEGFLRPFLDYGRSSAPLLALVLHTSSLTSETQIFVRQILRALGDGDGAPKPLPKAELAALSTAASITAREQQVLRLVSAGLSNREIAVQFSFAESTVKTHLKNIYRKLGVNSRTRAIAQAQALKLV